MQMFFDKNRQTYISQGIEITIWYWADGFQHDLLKSNQSKINMLAYSNYTPVMQW